MNHGIYNKSVSRPRKSKFQDTPQPIYYDFSEFSDDDSQEYYEQTSMRQKSPVSKSWSSSSDASAQIRGHRFSDRSERPVSGSLRSRGNSDAGTMNKPRIPSELLNNQHFLKVTESEGKETLKIQETGSFLIRLSQNPSCFCTLMVKTEKGVVRVQIAKIDGEFCLYSNNTCSDQKFGTLDGLLDWYTCNEMPCSMRGIYLRNYESDEQKGAFYLS